LVELPALRKNQIGEWIDGNVEQARYLHELATADVILFLPRFNDVHNLYPVQLKLSDEQSKQLHHEVTTRIEKADSLVCHNINER
jgi:hypothetical protein